MPIAATNTLINSQYGQPAAVTRVRTAVQLAARTLRLWRGRYRDRHAFPLIDERALRDLRLSRWDVERELAKPFWRG
jgi:uncharacterized protein YjiS (DUF1127 family)